MFESMGDEAGNNRQRTSHEAPQKLATGEGADNSKYEAAESFSPRVPSTVTSPQPPPVPPVNWAWGHNTPLTPEEAKRGLLELVQRKAAGGRDVPKDLFDFMQRATVV